MKFTHRKKTYYATCIQWDGKNTEMIIELLDRAGCDAHPYGGELMLKWRSNEVNPSIDMFKVGSWLRLGENDVLKVMTDAEFKLKYEGI